jgi:hypothetical protein
VSLILTPILAAQVPIVLSSNIPARLVVSLGITGMTLMVESLTFPS